jgi:hypothetical protein
MDQSRAFRFEHMSLTDMFSQEKDYKNVMLFWGFGELTVDIELIKKLSSTSNITYVTSLPTAG